MGECEACVGRAQSWEEATLVGVEQAIAPGDG